MRCATAGDEEYQSMREGDESEEEEEEEEEAGDSGDFEEHSSMNKEQGVQSHSETTFGNTVSATEGANTDSGQTVFSSTPSSSRFYSIAMMMLLYHGHQICVRSILQFRI
jgi:hypothetical protein